MSFIQNTWYAAAWSREITRSLLPRTIANENIVFYRTEAGDIAALTDRCPHRFVPLHLGKLKGDIVECGYHGLCFDSSGACTLNPHGDGAIPRAAKVKSYKVVEKYDVAWLWLGDASKADESLIADFSVLTNPKFRTASSYLHVKANYQLISDNLLDLSHGQYIHPMFKNAEGPPKFEAEKDPQLNEVWARFSRPNQFPNKYFQMLGYPKDQRGDHRNFMRWNAPSLLLLDVGMTGVGRPPEEGLSIPTSHLLTPETETTTHYFWAMSRDFRQDEDELSEELLRVGVAVFDDEDKPVIEAQQRRVNTQDLMSLKPVLLQTDGPAVRARRIVEAQLRAEQP
ncbi:aromatic ring-hydroxylating dioxygenase subunit alpha [Bradyrhizobium sp. CCBAU 53421]|uniref:aromatic ring-hydroxylating dioxygenase subunit alpha n=1 Tax=Bradyrhizobium sp. CCBAU 53421 TaxID=1325120 RepID=UPI00188C9BC9|nr:aromatic ring-hydroxylating dioxygenase subunit alpha [Bradyrhizobium sp. CCBAU 53421]QOZ31661.1 aromatic ring-hydroxylating dioxygenase subunit alpha [Bradyrhizobium sp. CCBAU 53421]